MVSFPYRNTFNAGHLIKYVLTDVIFRDIYRANTKEIVEFYNKHHDEISFILGVYVKPYYSPRDIGTFRHYTMRQTVDVWSEREHVRLSDECQYHIYMYIAPDMDDNDTTNKIVINFWRRRSAIDTTFNNVFYTLRILGLPVFLNVIPGKTIQHIKEQNESE